MKLLLWEEQMQAAEAGSTRMLLILYESTLTMVDSQDSKIGDVFSSILLVVLLI